VHKLDARVGGGYRMSFTNFTTGHSHSFGGRCTELVPHERIRYTDRFDDPNLPGEMQVTINLRAVPSGTELDGVGNVPGTLTAPRSGVQIFRLVPAARSEGSR